MSVYYKSIGAGRPILLGANKDQGGYTFSVEVPKGESASLVLYKKGESTPLEEIPFPEENRIGDVMSISLGALAADKLEYNYRIGKEICHDPYAYLLVGRKPFGQPIPEEEHSIRCGFLSERKYEWQDDRRPAIPYEDLVLYKLHVRGYTKQGKVAPSRKGTFRGLIDMIPYFKEMGINALELMPAYEFDEVRPPVKGSGHVKEKNPVSDVNFWGYLPGYYFAPKASYALSASPDREFRDLVKALHKNNMECIMEMYFPREINPFIALRVVQFWRMYYHIDGFHLIGDGVPVDLILRNQLLTDTKLLFAGFDPSSLRPLSRTAARYDQGFLTDIRSFLKSDEGMTRAAANRIKENQNDYAVINFLAYQDGFTMKDMVSYNYKHNEANHEENHDGCEFNYTWNCGVEGPSQKPAVRKMRQQQLFNAFALLLLSAGVPMIYAGDEFGNSQEGNNNAYCQDNPIGWVSWKLSAADKRLQKFVRETLAFRKAHPCLHPKNAFQGVDYKAKGYPDISFHSDRAWYISFENTSRLLGIMYCGAYAEKEDGSADDNIYIACNFHWEERVIAVPSVQANIKWKKVLDTGKINMDALYQESEEQIEKQMVMYPRSIVVLLGKKEEN